MTATTEEKSMAPKFDEQGKAEYARRIFDCVHSGEMDQDEADMLLLMLEFADENGAVSIPAELIEGAE